jgi:glutamyl-Q tRNA(Asp) synthetase
VSDYVGRFAPSPTGPLHFGSLVAAIASWLDARAAGGRWLLRIEDVDEPRTVDSAADAILHALDALGMHADGEIVYQSRRTALYADALEQLRRAGRVYRCHCSRREIADSALRGPEGAIYPGTCRGDLATFRASQGIDARDCAVRLAVDDDVVRFTDRVQGAIEQHVAREIGDFVLLRRDGLFAYQLAVVVDDALQGVTDVVRGADLLGSTARQVLLQRALGFPMPRYLHFPVAVDAAGEKLSKQTRAQPVDVHEGPALIARALAFLGQAGVERDTPGRMLEQARAQWDVARIGRTLARPLPEAA